MTLVVIVWRRRTYNHRVTVERIARDRDQVVEPEPRDTNDSLPLGARQRVKAWREEWR